MKKRAFFRLGSRVPKSLPEVDGADAGEPGQSLGAVEALLLVAFAVLACRAQRMVMWWALVMSTAIAPSVVILLTRWRKKTPFKEEERSAASTVILALLILLTVMSTPWTRAYNVLLPAAKRAAHAPDEPVAAVRFLEQGGYGGRVFNTMEWGGYLSWHLDPRIKVFIDPRIDFFGDDVWNDYLLIGRADPGWQEALDRHGVDLVVWNRQLSQQLPEELAKSRRWKNIYQDDVATIFARAKP